LIDFKELMDILSIPRPNGSKAEENTLQALKNWLTDHDIIINILSFIQYPYFFETIGLWLILSRTLLVIAFGLRWGWGTLLIAAFGLIGGTLDVAINLPLVSWFGRRHGQNIIIDFQPIDVKKELLLSAHYDTKTELLDHRKRMFLLKNLRLGIFLTIAIGLLGPIDRILINHQSSWSYFTWGLGLGLCIPTILLAWALGVNLISGRFLKPSLGAVDNGAACAILLALADELASKTLITKETKVTIALFSGEEVNMQGSRAYVNQREWNYPTVAINLEVMAQNGEYVYWEQDGNSLGLMATSEEANQLIKSSVNAVTGHPPEPAGPINSDGFSFLSQGIPTGILGTYDMDWKDTGFHRPSDNLQRVVMERLPQGVDILKILITKYDQEATCHGS
jgi:hypothetical protein